MPRLKTLLPVTLLLWCSCQPTGSERSSARDLILVENGKERLMVRRYNKNILPNGKTPASEHFTDLFVKARLDTFDLPLIDGKVLSALEQQLKLLSMNKVRKNHRIGTLSFGPDQLQETIEILRSRQHTKPFDLHKLLDAYQIWGDDRKGNVLFTGYFTPVIPVKAEPDEEYRFPIYDRPRDWTGGLLPSRAEIEGEGAFRGMGLEIAYARDKVDIYYMQVQGSGFVEYPDGSRQLLSFNGSNRYPYRSIEKYLMSREDLEVPNYSIGGIKRFLGEHPEIRDTVLFQNPSYTFFKARFTQPKGAGNVPLQQDLSVAVDRRYIPLGSCLLAAIPIYDPSQHRIIGHEYRILFAQDVGGKIKGPGHVDLYFGVGPENQARAMRMKHYGRIWLLLPKQQTDLITMN